MLAGPSAALGLVLALCVAEAARAQVGASVNLQSDYRYRGRSLSDRRPTLALNLSYDHKSGLYAGGSAIAEDTRRQGVQMLGYLTYAGYAARSGNGPSWDVGVTNLRVTDYRTTRRTAQYTEFYAGALTDHLSFRLYYAPDYYDTGLKTVYADLGASFRPAPNLRVFGHAGLLAPVGGRMGRTPRDRYDFSAGVAASRNNLEVSLTWSTFTPEVYVNGRKEPADAVVLGASYFF